VGVASISVVAPFAASAEQSIAKTEEAEVAAAWLHRAELELSDHALELNDQQLLELEQPELELVELEGAELEGAELGQAELGQAELGQAESELVGLGLV